MAQLAESSDQLEAILLVRTLKWYCAFPVEAVRETCRPLPFQAVQGVPPFVRGVSVIRGVSTPVLHLGMMLSGEDYRPGQRLVNVLISSRPVAFEVDEVLGVRRLSRTQLATTQPLVRGTLTNRIESLSVLDGELLAWLDAAKLVENELLDLVLSEGWA